MEVLLLGFLLGVTVTLYWKDKKFKKIIDSYILGKKQIKEEEKDI